MLNEYNFNLSEKFFNINCGNLFSKYIYKNCIFYVEFENLKKLHQW